MISRSICVLRILRAAARHGRRALGGPMVSVAAASAIAGASAPANAQLACFSSLRAVADEFTNATLEITSADIDGDGDLDVLYGDFFGLDWMENDGAADPTFTHHAISTTGNPRIAVGADLDGDGDIDILSQDNGIVWFENDGAPVPTFTRHVLSADVPNSAVIADLDGDGDPDLIVTATGSSVMWFENDGAPDPTFTKIVITSTISAVDVEVADLDGDLDLDIVVPRFDFATGNVYWLENDGAIDPAFTERLLGAVGNQCVSVDVGDLDGDGDIDAAAVSALNTTLDWFENVGGSPPTFVKRAVDPWSVVSQDVDFADIDGDGDIDLVIGASADGRIVWWANDGQAPPSFSAQIAGSGVDAFDVLATDLNGDGAVDIVMPGGGSASIEFILQLHVENLSSGLPSPVLATAVASASSGDALLAYPEHFQMAFAPQILLPPFPLFIESRGALAIPASAEWTVPNDLELIAGPGEMVDIVGSIAAPGGAHLELTGDAVRITGRVDLGASGASLTANADTTVEGAARFERLLVGLDAGQAPNCFPADLDGDGDLDIVASGGSDPPAAWFENLGGSPPQFERREFEPFGQPSFHVDVADLDGDGDLDVLNIAIDDGDVQWLDNDGNAPPTFTSRSIAGSSGGRGVSAGDLDGDGDLDVMAAMNQFFWYESDGQPTPTFTQRSFPSAAPFGGFRITPADVDGDGDLDAVCGISSGLVVWMDNQGGSPPTFTARTIATIAGGLAHVVPADLDDDGDTDILATGWSDILVWCENLGGSPPSFAQRTIDASAPDIGGASTVDMDLDGDLDIVAGQSEPIWYENLGTTPPTFAPRSLGPSGIGSTWAVAGDLDGDGDPDIITNGVPNGSGAVRWYSNAFQRDQIIPGGSQIVVNGALRAINRSVRLDPSAGITAQGGGAEVSLDRRSVLAGTGAVDAPVLRSAGTVAPDAGAQFEVFGSYVQSFDNGIIGPVDGTLRIDLTNPAAPSTLTALVDATLAGALVVTTDAPLDPQTIATPVVVTAGAINGSRFDVALLPNIGASDFLSLVYNEGGALQLGDRAEVERALATVSLQAQPLSGDVDLDPQAGADSGNAGIPKGATLADIDGDGDPDLLIALPDATSPTTATGSVVILYNADDGNPGNGWEGFGDTLQITAGVGVNPSSVAVGRIDADAQPDIIVANRGTPGNAGTDTVSVLLVSDPSAASFALSATPTVSVGDEPADVIVFDLDGDGFLDIATADAGSSSMSVAWNAGAGVGPGWTPPNGIPLDLPDDEETPVSIRPGDTNAGTFTFLATANAGNSTVGLIQVNTDRTTVVRPSVLTGEGPVELVVADFDRDGEADIATVNRNGSSVTITLGQTGGNALLTFGLPSDLPIPSVTSKPRSIAAGDFDADAAGDIDLAILADGVVKILRNDLFNGQLAFTPIADQPGGASPLLVRSGDLNGDGRDDVVTIAESAGALLRATGGRSAESVAILLAQTAPACSGDINSDGSTNAADFVTLAGNFGATVTPNTGGDLNGDGLVNAADFVILAGDFGCGS